jgi:non-ribosomal peptide synthetase component F
VDRRGQDGKQAEVRIGVCRERSPELVVALPAVLKAGGAFVPVDLVFSRERLAYRVADAGVRMAIAATVLPGRVPAGLRIVHADAAAELAGRARSSRWAVLLRECERSFEGSSACTTLQPS